MDREAWWATVHRVTEVDTLKQHGMRAHAYIHIYTHTLLRYKLHSKKYKIMKRT